MTATDRQTDVQKLPTASLPLPADLFARIIAFLGAQASGQVVIDVHQGKIKGARITEIVRADEESAV